MAGDSDSRFARRARLVGIFAVLTWASCAFWNSVKPLPPGTHVSSLPARLAESQVDFIDDDSHRGESLKREIEAVGRAEQMIVLDQCPLAHELAKQLLLRKRQRPNIKIMLVTDPRNEVYGGTPAQTLSTLEAAGIIVARTRLARLRDSNPLYSSVWRLSVGWWSDPFDEVPGQVTLSSTLRRRNFKADRRQLLVADDGAGGWTSIVLSASAAGGTAGAGVANVGLEIRGHLARDIVASELRIAAWSTDDDRLPTAPPMMSRGVGTIDARFLTEGAIHTALRDVIAVAGSGDSIDVVVWALDDRRMVDAMLLAAARGARLQLLLRSDSPGTRAAAGELVHNAAGNIEVRWQTAELEARYTLVRHRSDVWIDLGSANFTRRGLGDLDLTADIELHMPARAAAARAALDLFAREWSSAAAYADRADESRATYWRYRLADATGLTLF
jgi:PLD-like domain